MRVLVLHSDVPADAPPDEQDTLITAEAVADALRGLGHAVAKAAFALDAARLEALTRDTDVVFNLVESVLGQDCLAAAAPAMLDKLGCAYTGAGAAAIALTADKPLAKTIMRAAGLATPDWAQPPHWKGLRDGMRHIVKSATDDASLGLDDGAVVAGREAVAQRARLSQARFGGRWFAEAFVEGREFNLALLDDDGEPVVLPIPEMRFEDWPDGRPTIVGYRAKWEPHSEEGERTVRRFGLEREEPLLAQALAEIARRLWRLFALSGYARVDFRVDTAGRPLVLEVNPNPCLEPEAGFAAAAAAAGLDYPTLIARVLAAAGGRAPCACRAPG